MPAHQSCLIKLLLSFLITSAIFLFSPRVIFAQNLLQNPGFEDGVLNWDKWGSGSLEITPESRSGSQAGKFFVSGTTTATFIYQVVLVIAGRAYQLSGFSKIVNGNGEIYLKISFYSTANGSGPELSSIQSTKISNPSNYVSLAIDGFEAPSGASSAKVKAYLDPLDEGQTVAYFDDLSFEEVTSLTTTLTPTPIPPSLTPTPTSTPTAKDYSNIFISEFMPYPESGNEWVELYNGNNFEVDLYGWYIDDIADGGSSPRSISGTISPSGYKQFFLSSAYLNNGGDDVRLLNGNQQEKDKKSFESSIKGKSWVKDKNGNWCQIEPTPNAANPDCPSVEENSSPTPTPTPTPKAVKVVGTTLSGEILGEEEATPEAFYPWQATTEAEEAQEATPSKKRILPYIFLGSGLVFLAAAAYSLWYTKLRWPKEEG